MRRGVRRLLFRLQRTRRGRLTSLRVERDRQSWIVSGSESVDGSS